MRFASPCNSLRRRFLSDRLVTRAAVAIVEDRMIAVDSGVDFPSILLSTLNGAPSGPPPAYEIGIRNRWLWGDFDSLLLTLRSGDVAARFRAVAEFMKLWRAGLHYENPRLGDLKPWFRETRQRIAALGGGGAH